MTPKELIFQGYSICLASILGVLVNSFMIEIKQWKKSFRKLFVSIIFGICLIIGISIFLLIGAIKLKLL